MKSKEPLDKYLIGVLIASAIFVVFWVGYANYCYTTYRSAYYDIGVATYSMYLHISNAGYPLNLEYLVFANHLSPLQVLLLPVFAAFPSPITLIFSQDLFLALAAILIYLVGKDVLGSKKLGLAFTLAYLLNPGLMGVASYDFHMEAFFIFFYILAFYFYIRNKGAHFLISYLALLLVIEEAPAVGGSLLLGLLIYELSYNRKSRGAEGIAYKRRLRLLLAGFVLTALTLGFYAQASTQILNMYNSTSYSAVPPPVRLTNIVATEVSFLLAPPSNGSYGLYVAGMYGLVLVFFGFGLTSLVNLLVSLAMYLPYIFGAFVSKLPAFPAFYFQYYSYVLGGSFVSAAIGYLALIRRKVNTRLFGLDRMEGSKYAASVEKLSLMFLIVVIFCSYVTSLIVYASTSPTLIAQRQLNYTQINQVLAAIPENSTVMAQTTLTPHLFRVHSLELPINSASANCNSSSGDYTTKLVFYWFKPDYIVADEYLAGYGDFNDACFNLASYMAHNYTTYYNSSGLYIFRRIAANQT